MDAGAVRGDNLDGFRIIILIVALQRSAWRATSRITPRSTMRSAPSMRRRSPSSTAARSQGSID